MLVFSSSCTVYGIPERVPIDEEVSTRAMSPYGRTKLYIEDLLHDVADSDPAWHFLVLRYFNPVAAHPSGHMGEHPIGVPQNLMPFVQQVCCHLLLLLRSSVATCACSVRTQCCVIDRCCKERKKTSSQCARRPLSLH